jgi:hypothetical protein
MFQFSPFAPLELCVHSSGDPALPGPGFPIRASPGLSLFAATRSLSQLTTPFIASPCQGIPHVPLVALPAADSGRRPAGSNHNHSPRAEQPRAGAQNVQGRSLGLLLIGCQRAKTTRSATEADWAGTNKARGPRFECQAPTDPNRHQRSAHLEPAPGMVRRTAIGGVPRIVGRVSFGVPNGSRAPGPGSSCRACRRLLMSDSLYVPRRIRRLAEKPDAAGQRCTDVGFHRLRSLHLPWGRSARDGATHQSQSITNTNRRQTGRTSAFSRQLVMPLRVTRKRCKRPARHCEETAARRSTKQFHQLGEVASRSLC